MVTPNLNDNRYSGIKRPKMMAIGDSLYNGTQTLTTGPELPALSVPAQVAKALGINDFRIPDYPIYVLIDALNILDSMPHLPDPIKPLVPLMVANAKSWQNRTPAKDQYCFDNVAVAQSEVADIWSKKAKDMYAAIPGLITRLEAGDFKAIPDLYYAINASYLLNPSRSGQFAEATQLDWVAWRRPERLLINIGSNNGLFMTLLNARLDDSYKAKLADLPNQISTLAEKLKPLTMGTDAIENIYFNSLVRPRVVGNLCPYPQGSILATPGDYFDQYYGVIATESGPVSGDSIKDIDDFVADINQQVKDVLTKALGSKVALVDLWRLADVYDSKHLSGVRVDLRYRGDDIHISNLPFDTWPIVHSYKQGGFFSLDHLHPSSVGYATIAIAVLEMIRGKEGVTPITPVNLQAALDSDPLFRQPPRSLHEWMALYEIYTTIFG